MFLESDKAEGDLRLLQSWPPKRIAPVRSHINYLIADIEKWRGCIDKKKNRMLFYFERQKCGEDIKWIEEELKEARDDIKSYERRIEIWEPVAKRAIAIYNKKIPMPGLSLRLATLNE